MAEGNPNGIDADLQLSAAQRAIWIDLQLSPARAPFYNTTAYVEISGAVDASILEQAVRDVVRSAAALRARFVVNGQEVRQIIRTSVEFDVEHGDFSASPDAHGSALDWMNARRQQWFDPLVERLLCFAVLRVSPHMTYLYCQLHHLIIDGVGLKLCMERIAKAYSARIRGSAPETQDDLPLLAAYIANDATYAASEQCAIDSAFWASQRTAPTSLCVHRQGSSPAGMILQTSTQYFPSELTEGLSQLSQRLQLATPQLLIAAVTLYLFRALGRERISIGLPTHGRVESWMRSLLAMCSNVLPLSLELDRSLPVVDCLLSVHRQMGDAMSHRRTRYDEIRRLQNIRVGDLGHYEIVINALPFAIGMDFGGSTGRARNLTARYVPDLSLWLFAGANGELALKLDAHPGKYDRWEIDTHASNLQRFLHAIVARPTVRLSQVALIDAADFSKLAGKLEQPVMAPLVHQLVERQVDVSANAVAVICGERSITFAELDREANRVANTLLALDIGAKANVAVLMERTLQAPTAILGILKSGAAFVPLDPEWPRERQQHVLQNSRAAALLTSKDVPRHALPQDCRVIDLEHCSAGSSERPGRTVQPGDLAYCIYTSGTTGRPQGVAVEHASMLNHVLQMAREFQLTAADRVLQFFSMAFDQWIEEVFPTWISGATLVIQPQKVLGLDAFCELIAREKISVMHLPVAYWHMCGSELSRAGRRLPPALRLVNVGGEAVMTESYRRWLSIPEADRIELVNTYGPTEAAVTTTLYRLSAADVAGPISIGRSIDNTFCYVLDSQQQPCPPGVAGELCIGGAGLARGYINDAEKTAARFVTWAFDGIERRIYKTGDIARYRADGNIEFLGRNDRQIKLRGHRIELDEIEAVLSAHPDVQQCAVILRSGEHQPAIIAFFVVRTHVTSGSPAWRDYLSRILPEYMMPARLIALDALPTNSAGKVDRNSLSQLAVELPEPASEFTAPRTALEQAIAAIWAESLQVERVSVDDDLFALGADSLTAVHVLFRLQSVTSRPLTLAQLFESRTVARLAARLEAG